jgi:hypothetical protein
MPVGIRLLGLHYLFKKLLAVVEGGRPLSPYFSGP